MPTRRTAVLACSRPRQRDRLVVRATTRAPAGQAEFEQHLERRRAGRRSTQASIRAAAPPSRRGRRRAAPRLRQQRLDARPGRPPQHLVGDQRAADAGAPRRPRAASRWRRSCPRRRPRAGAGRAGATSSSCRAAPGRCPAPRPALHPGHVVRRPPSRLSSAIGSGRSPASTFQPWPADGASAHRRRVQREALEAGADQRVEQVV